MTRPRFSAPADGYAEIPAEHVEAYNEMCQQFVAGILNLYKDALPTLIMRELPPALQMNAISVGATIAGLIPLLMKTPSKHDAEIIEALRASLPLAVASARKMADQIVRGRS